MKQVVIFHGTDCKPSDFWYEWLKIKLENRGYQVELPSYPKINHDDLAEFLPMVMRNHKLNDDTILIGHSAGSPLILSILENSNVKIRQAILVAGFSSPLGGVSVPILQDKYNWENIRKNCESFVMFNSPNDPYGS